MNEEPRVIAMPPAASSAQAPGDQEPPERSGRFLAMAGSASGIAAIGLALLYAIGLVADAGQITAAGYSPQDVLPLIPLPQALGRGVGVLLDVKVLFAFLLLVLQPAQLVWTSHSSGKSREWHVAEAAKRETQLAVVARVLARLRAEPQADNAVLDEVQAHVNKASALADPTSSPRDLERAYLEAAAAARRLESECNRLQLGDTLLRELRDVSARERRVRTKHRAIYAVMALGVAGLAVSTLLGKIKDVPYSFALLVFLLVVYGRMLMEKPLGPHIVRRGVVAILVFLVLAEAYLAARPPRQAAVQLKDGRVVSGAVLAQPATQSGVWYLGTDPGVIEATESSRAGTVRISPPKHYTNRYAKYSLWDVIRGRAHL